VRRVLEGPLPSSKLTEKPKRKKGKRRLTRRR
jgi:hypothetical protein